MQLWILDQWIHWFACDISFTHPCTSHKYLFWREQSGVATKALLGKVVLTVGCIWRLIAVSCTGWALVWFKLEWRAWGLMVEWKIVACWLGVEGWCAGGLGSTGTGCCDGWMEAVCSDWPGVLWELWLWRATNCCCCLCCWTRELGWIWVYAGNKPKAHLWTFMNSHSC